LPEKKVVSLRSVAEAISTAKRAVQAARKGATPVQRLYLDKHLVALKTLELHAKAICRGKGGALFLSVPLTTLAKK
jgi:hypothetical protein